MMNPSLPRVSVLTSCYKSERYLEIFLSNLENQTLFPNFEVLLDLNSPSQAELDISNRYKVRYGSLLKITINETVSPLGEAWNRCIRISSGEYLTIWNVDDERTSNSLEVQAAALNSNPEYGAVYGPYGVINEPGQIKARLVENKVSSPLMHLSGFYLGPFFMFKREVIDLVGYFDEQFRSGNDFDFAVRLARSFQILRIDDVLGNFLDEGMGASTRTDSDQAIESAVIQLRYGQFKNVDKNLLPYLLQYSLPLLKWEDKWWSVSEYFPNYEAYIEEIYREQKVSRNSGRSVRRKAANLVRNLGA
jgi:glycosyltransferase involved in cell wall biosynthesis